MPTTPKSLFFMIFISSFCLISCERRASFSETLIYGGQPVESDAWQAVVAITRHHNTVDNISCSGTLISTRHVLTAGHCVDDLALRNHDEAAIASLGILIGSGTEGGRVQRTASVKSVVVSENLRVHPSGHSDIALIELNDEILDVTPVKLLASITNFQRLFMKKGVQIDDVLLVGYGRRDDGGFGLKFMVDATIRPFNAWESIAGGSGRDACYGDSGGPIFFEDKKGEWQQYGVISRSWTFECGNGGYVTNIAPHACWIEQHTGIKSQDTFVQCQNQPKKYSESTLNQISFLPLCQGKGANVFQKETIERLKIRFATNSCRLLEAELLKSKLNLGDLLIRDLSPLAPFKDMTTLDLSNNLITDASVLTELNYLEVLDITANNIKSPSALFAPLEENGTFVFGKRSQIHNFRLTPFLSLCKQEGLTPEKKITVEAIIAKTLANDCETANARLLTMKNLDLSERGLTDISPLAGLSKLEILDISKNPVFDISPLTNLERLRILEIRETMITDLSSLEPLERRGLSIKR